MTGALSVMVRGTRLTGESVWGTVRPANFAWLTVLAAVGLSAVGLHAIDVAERLVVGPEMARPSPLFFRQLLFVCVGAVAALAVALPHQRFLGWIAMPMLVITIGLLIFLLLPFVPDSIVTPRNGSRRWINLGVVDFQPGEIAKVAYVLAIARYLRYRRQHRRFLGLAPLGLITFVPMVLIILQPDLGTGLLFLPALFAMLLAAGARIRHLAIIVLAAGLAAPAAYPFLKPYQKQRLIGLVRQVQGDRTTAHDINYQSFTAQTVAGSGGLGGLGESRARAVVHFNRLPERHNDMIFSVIVARFGFLGGLGVLSLYALWLLGAVLTAAQSRDPFGRLIAVGLAAFIASQVFINVGMNIGLVPIIGVTLPLISYGGSSVVTVWIMTGLILGVALHKPRPPYRESFEYDDDDEQHS